MEPVLSRLPRFGITAQLLSPILLRPSLATSTFWLARRPRSRAPTVEQKTVTLRVVYETGAVRDVIPIAVEKKDGAYAGTYKLDLNGFTASCDAEMATIDETGLVSFSFQDDEPVTIVVTLRGEKATYTVNHYKRGANEGEETLAESVQRGGHRRHFDGGRGQYL